MSLEELYGLRNSCISRINALAYQIFAEGYTDLMPTLDSKQAELQSLNIQIADFSTSLG